MHKTAVVTARMNAEKKAHAEAIFKRLGLTTTQAIELFFTQVELQGGLPFSVNLPNAETRRAIADVKAGRNLTAYKNVDEWVEQVRADEARS